MIIYSIFTFDKNTLFPGFNALIPTIGTVLLILSAVPNTFIHKLLSQKLLVSVGLISYSAYLWHQPILVIFRLAYGVHLDFNATMLALILSFIIAYISWKHFEVPLRHTKFSQKKVFRLVGLSMIFFSFVSLGFSYQIKKKNPGSLSGTLTELSSYVSKKQKDIETQEVNFPKNGKENLLIIGDSFSQDFINIIFESSLDNNFNYASVYIKYRCKNLNIEKNTLINLIDPENREICERSSHYSDKKTQNLIRRADKIILASDWETEDLQFINQSIQNIKNLTSAEIIIVGSKIFLADGYGNYNLFRRNTYKMTKQELGDMRFSLPAEYIEMKNILSGFNFIDITEAYCEKDQCTFVDNNNYLHIPKDVKYKNFSLDLEFIYLSEEIIQKVEQVLKKYQILIDQIISLEYLRVFFDERSDNTFLLAKKITEGCNENEVDIISKIPKNIGFFEKFFNFFS